VKNENGSPEAVNWQCHHCRRELIVGPVTVTYLGNRFTTDLPHCPDCRLILVPENLALGKMAEVEQILEDK
jgi:hypothetical protein